MATATRHVNRAQGEPRGARHLPAHPLDGLAVWITRRVGSMGFFLAVFTWTAIWLLWNFFAPRHLRFDPFPGFVLWLFISNMIQLFLMPLLLIGQNLLGKGAEERAKSDFDVNRKAEKEIKEIRTQLDAILARLDKLEPGRQRKE
ncbi:MAG TPA: DUF1003 domain-containing protein [Terracidiphilus sp.]|nr:DUF1003 domain-containing protein [Terracidiphilus sp.]